MVEDATVDAEGSPTDAAAAALGALDEAPLEGHVDIYEDVHRRLQEALADVDEQ